MHPVQPTPTPNFGQKTVRHKLCNVPEIRRSSPKPKQDELTSHRTTDRSDRMVEYETALCHNLMH